MELNNIIDSQIEPERPRFIRDEVEMGGETFEFHYRDVLECTRALFGDPEFAEDLVFAPERHYTDVQKHNRVYSEIETGAWWWDRQVHVICSVAQLIILIQTCWNSSSSWKRIVPAQPSYHC